MVKPKDQEMKDKELDCTLAGLDYYMSVNDNPLTQEVHKLVKESDVVFLNIKEVGEDDPEPRYFILDGAESQGSARKTILLISTALTVMMTHAVNICGDRTALLLSKGTSVKTTILPTKEMHTSSS